MTVETGGKPLDMGPARTLGDLLRHTRVAAGASLEQVESDLRIKAKYIEAIEDGDTAALPSRAYTDGFLRNYATYLGLDPAETVQRFAGENGLATPKRQAKPTAIPVQRPGANPLSNIGQPATAQRRSAAGSFGRSIAAVWPILLVAGLGFGGYTGFVAARDAGLIPPELGGTARAPEMSKKTEPVKVAEAAPTAENKLTEPTVRENPIEDTETASVAATPTLQARAETVGNETSRTGGARPDSLSYARPGAIPYWKAKAPAVTPADGPVSEIEPETAGVVRPEEARDEDDTARTSRWSVSASRQEETPPTDADASRIAAEARAALASTFGLELSEPQAPESDVAEVEDTLPAASDPALTPDIDPVVAAAEDAPFDPNEQIAGIGPLETAPLDGTSLQPAPPAQAPRAFALYAAADTWVQVQDAIGTVTYTGIMSAGESYNIPAVEGLRLKTGNAGGLFIEVDGQRFGPLGTSGAVMRNVVLSPGAVRASFTLSQAASLARQ